MQNEIKTTDRIEKHLENGDTFYLKKIINQKNNTSSTNQNNQHSTKESKIRVNKINAEPMVILLSF